MIYLLSKILDKNCHHKKIAKFTLLHTTSSSLIKFTEEKKIAKKIVKMAILLEKEDNFGDVYIIEPKNKKI